MIGVLNDFEDKVTDFHSTQPYIFSPFLQSTQSICNFEAMKEQKKNVDKDFCPRFGNCLRKNGRY